MKTYFNIETSGKMETIDELDSSYFSTLRDFLIESLRMTKDYRQAGIPVYRTQRCTEEWSKVHGRDHHFPPTENK